MVCSNFSYDGSNIVIEPNPIFKAVIKNSMHNRKLPRLYRIIAPHYAVVHYILLTQNYRSLCSVLLRRFASLQPTQNPLDSSQVGSSPNTRNLKQRKSRDKPDSFLCNKKLPEPSKIRTGVNDMSWLKELHDTIKYTPYSYFKNLQNFIRNIN